MSKLIQLKPKFQRRIIPLGSKKVGDLKKYFFCFLIGQRSRFKKNISSGFY